MISVNLCGGLGNQLFQIYTVIAYSLKHKVPFTFPIHKFDQQKRKTYWDNGEFFSSLRVFLTQNLNGYLRYREPFFEFSLLPPPPKERKTKLCLDGYFQSYKYFNNERVDISRLIGLPDKIQRVKDIMLENVKSDYGDDLIEKRKTFISMHFRMGDYKHLQQHHNLLPDIYYMKALMAILQHCLERNLIVNDKVVVLFFCEKEDLEIVKTRIASIHSGIKSIINQDIELEFIRVQDLFNDWQQMLLMSLCDHNIIANSSYSWWGAYFNENPKKFVTYPPVWFGPTMANKNTSDLCPTKWHKIKL